MTTKEMEMTYQTRYVDDPQPDGDPDAHGAIGCPLCDTVWASGDSVDRHLDVVHHTTYDDAARYVPVICEDDDCPDIARPHAH